MNNPEDPENPATEAPKRTFGRALDKRVTNLRKIKKPASRLELQKETQLAQGTLMAVHAMFGKTLQEIGEIFGCSTYMVKHRMDAAQKAGVLDLAQDLVKSRLIPKALAVYETKLLAGDLEAARDIMFGSGTLTKNATLKVAPDTGSLESWRERYFTSQQALIEGEVTKTDEDA